MISFKGFSISTFFKKFELAVDTRAEVSVGRVESGGAWSSQRFHPRHSRSRRKDGSSGQARLYRQVLEWRLPTLLLLLALASPFWWSDQIPNGNNSTWFMEKSMRMSLYLEALELTCFAFGFCSDAQRKCSTCWRCPTRIQPLPTSSCPASSTSSSKQTRHEFNLTSILSPGNYYGTRISLLGCF